MLYNIVAGRATTGVPFWSLYTYTGEIPLKERTYSNYAPYIIPILHGVFWDPPSSFCHPNTGFLRFLHDNSVKGFEFRVQGIGMTSDAL